MLIALTVLVACGGERTVAPPSTARPLEPTVAGATATPVTTAAPTPPSTSAPPTSPASTLPSTLPPTTGPITAPPDGGPSVRLMVLGDSVSGGGGPGFGAYRGPLQALFAAAGFTNLDFVGSQSWVADGGDDPDHEGHGAYTIGPDESSLESGGRVANLDAYLDEWLTSAEPDYVLLMAGLNDMFPKPERGEDGVLRDVAPIEAAAKLEALVLRIQGIDPAIGVFVLSYPEIGYLSGYEPWEVLHGTADALGTIDGTDRIWYVPVREVTSIEFTPSDFTEDETHPTEEGAAKIARVVFDVVGPVLVGAT
jgi:hypothetical protein